eukprot:501310-Pyramimonas_sp.AAC.1
MVQYSDIFQVTRGNASGWSTGARAQRNMLWTGQRERANEEIFLGPANGSAHTRGYSLDFARIRDARP